MEYPERMIFSGYCSAGIAVRFNDTLIDNTCGTGIADSTTGADRV